jgi:bifunctional UDP-N-acetylglucosamine pyrophosphorylase/glucosamine-1-phosphate N-acetyltransferase
MLPLANKPMLEHVLLEAVAAGISEYIFVTGYYTEQVEDYFSGGRKWAVSIDYCRQPHQKGTADAVKQVKGKIDGNFLVLNGDSLATRNDIADLAGYKEDTMAIAEVEDTGGLGVVEINRDNVICIYEKMAKPSTNLVNAGLYLFTPRIFETIDKTPMSPRGEYEITDSIQVMIDDGYGLLYHKISNFKNLAYPWHLLDANKALLGGLEALNRGEVESGVVMKGNVAIGEDSRVLSGTYIAGPVVIGKDCRIGPNCYIRPATAIGNGCHIGAAVEIKNSIIMKGARVPHHNYVGDSIIGEYCNLGSGTKIANLRLDNQNIEVNGVDTGRRKLGAILGDGVETGINSSINVGSLVGNGVFIGPGVVAGGVIPPRSRVF